MAMKHVFQNKKFKNRELDIMKQIDSRYVVKLHHHFYKEEQSVQAVIFREFFLT